MSWTLTIQEENGNGDGNGDEEPGLWERWQQLPQEQKVATGAGALFIIALISSR